MATGVRDIWLGLQGSLPDGGLVDGTQRVIPQSISTWGKLDSSARPCAEQAVAQFKKLVSPYSAHKTPHIPLATARRREVNCAIMTLCS